LTRVRESVFEGRIPPQNPDIEQAVLGAIMLDPDIFPAVREIIGPDSFYLDQHGIIFEACVSLYERGLKSDLPATLDELKRKGLLEKVGGAGYVASLLSAAPTAAHAEHHAYLVQEQYTLRALIRTCTEIIESAFGQQDSPEEILDQAEKAILEISKFGKAKGYSELGGVFDKLIEKITSIHDFRLERPGEPYYAGVRSNFPDIDELLRGFHPGSLNIIAARPGVGKTSLALNIGLNVAANNPQGLPVLLFSLEMPNEMLALRMVASESKLPIGRIESAELADNEWQMLSQSIRNISRSRILMNDSSALTVRQVANTARRVVSKYGGIALVIVDYLQLMYSGIKTENRVQEVSAISRGLKNLALDLRVPILACSQLSRQVESRKEQRPMLHDLRESGSIEQDADVVMFLSHWIPQGEEESAPAINAPDYAQKIKRRLTTKKHTDNMLCSIAKNRNGPVGDCPLLFMREYCKFVPSTWDYFLSADRGGRKSGGKS